jgi:hypothetical protein
MTKGYAIANVLGHPPEPLYKSGAMDVKYHLDVLVLEYFKIS